MSPIMKLAKLRAAALRQSAAAKQKHVGHVLTYQEGKWGPHTARYVCVDCHNQHVKWCKRR
jgi:hypothetical protein